MVTVAEATSIIQQNLLRPTTESVALANAGGRVLAEEVRADRDFPPFDRVAMDGVAIQFRAFQEGWQAFKVEGLQPAGQPRLTLKDQNNCIEVMTGAMLPIGCDTVIPYEDISVVREIAKLKVAKVEMAQCIHPRAQDAKRNDVLLAPGVTLSPAEVAILASVGRLKAEVYALPKTAIISTGTELVDIHDRPLPHQIRRSNSYSLQSALESMHCHPELFHLPDDRNQMEKEFIKIFATFELIILTGGVSKGKFDFVPEVLESISVSRLFHQVSQKPGKPFWFGITKRQVVFALPGNPVSSYLCFFRYIKPWLEKCIGNQKPFESVILASDFTFQPDLTYFLQVKIKNENGRLMAIPVPGGGSGDFANLKDVDGFIELPSGGIDFKAGESFSFIPFRS